MRSGLSVNSSILDIPAKTFRGMVRRARLLVRNAPDPSYFDLFDLSGLNALLTECGVAPLTADARQAEGNLAGVMRYVLGMLASRPRLRRNYPRALTDGPDGGYAKWLSARLAGHRAGQVRAAFDADPGRRVGRVYELREDLREIWPLALTPAQRRDFLRWLLTYGRSDFDLTPEATLWHMYEMDEDPSRGLVASFRLQPRWQEAVPHGLTRFGWDDLKRWVSRTYQFESLWLKRADLTPQYRPWDELQLLLQARPELRSTFPPRSDAVLDWVKSLKFPGADQAWLDGLAADIRSGFADRPGVNVIGLFRYTSGLQQAVRGCVAALDRSGVRTAVRDYPVLFLREPRDKARYDELELFDVTVLNTGIDTPVLEVYFKSGLHRRPGVYRVATWWWEMEQLPPKWLGRAADVDEVWAPTSFIAGAMRQAFADKPVFTMLPGMELPAFDPLPKSYFGMSPHKFTFGFVFDMNSRMQRKNPLGLIRAFRKAFQPADPVELVLKVSPPESYYGDQWGELRSVATSAGVKIIDRVLTRTELLGFVNALDAYASLHRSEGFGLTCAEAMLLGKPTVATAYSGNLDFMTEENSYLVRYSRAYLEEDIDPYFRGGVWAEPDLEHAAELMRRIVDRPDESKAVAARGQTEVGTILSLKAAGERLLTRLHGIRRERACG